MPKRKGAYAVKDSKGKTTGYNATCSRCEKPVHYPKGHRSWLGESERGPDSHCRCQECADYMKEHRMEWVFYRGRWTTAGLK